MKRNYELRKRLTYPSSCNILCKFNQFMLITILLIMLKIWEIQGI